MVGALRDAGRAAGDRLRGHARGLGGARRRGCARTRRAEAAAYHAGLDRGDAREVQRALPRGRDRSVIVATNAFGMGVDKPNVRTVVHASVPASLEAYYQEAGRAGRDGAPARALLLAENRDKALHVHFIKRDELDRAAARAGWRERADAACRSGDGRRYRARRAASWPQRSGCDADQLRALVGHLARAGVIAAGAVVAGPAVGPARSARSTAARRRLCRTSMGDAARARWRQYRDIWAFVEGDGCRRRAILRHFGDRAEPHAGGAVLRRLRPGAAARIAPPPDPVAIANLDEAIISVARMAKPSVGRTTCAEILHGARTKKIERNSYDGLPAYGDVVAHAPGRHPRRGSTS